MGLDPITIHRRGNAIATGTDHCKDLIATILNYDIAAWHDSFVRALMDIDGVVS